MDNRFFLERKDAQEEMVNRRSNESLKARDPTIPVLPEEANDGVAKYSIVVRKNVIRK